MGILNLVRDASGKETFIRIPDGEKYEVALVKDTNATLTLPLASNKYDVLFSYNPGASVWIAINNTATYSTSSNFTATNSELNPTAFRLNAGDVINAITSDDVDQVGVVIYAAL